MTNDLAKLLDGPVAERFGRPNGKDRCSIIADPEDTDRVREAIWLAHLIGECGSKHWGISMAYLLPGWECHIGYGFCKSSDVYAQPTAIEALSLAMLAVPENKP